MHSPVLIETRGGIPFASKLYDESYDDQYKEFTSIGIPILMKKWIWNNLLTVSSL